MKNEIKKVVKSNYDGYFVVTYANGKIKAFEGKICITKAVETFINKNGYKEYDGFYFDLI